MIRRSGLLSPRTIDLDLRIYVVPTGGGAPRRLPSGDVQRLDWSPRGDEIAYGDGAGRSRIIRTDGSKPRPVFHPPVGFGGPKWSPDGARLGFVGFGGLARRGRFTDRYAGINVATRTEATSTSSRAMRTTSAGSPGPRTGGGFSTAGRTARAST